MSYPRVRLLREGLYYLVVLGFIIGGAVLRQVNLLLIIAGLMAAPLLIDWRFAMAALRGFTMRRRAPDRVEAGVPFTVDLLARKRSARFDSWAVVLRDRIEHSGSTETTIVDVLASRVGATWSRATYRCTLHERGRYRFGPLSASNRFPLGLVEATQEFQKHETLLVVPKLGVLTASWKRAIEDESIGARRSQKRRSGASGEFYGLREWRSGDTRRWIHWRTSARIGKLAVRQFEQQRNLDLAIVLDLHNTGQSIEIKNSRVERAVSFVATIAHDWRGKAGSRFTLALSGDESTYMSGHASSQYVGDILEQLALVRPGDATDTSQLLGRCMELSAGDARIVVISTRDRPDEMLGSNLAEHHRLMHSRDRVQWINVASDTGREMFELS